MARDYPLEKVRNFGIVAHVDAGKTTTSERILYYTGESHKIGEVHEGNTVTDWMEQERERGITITAAAITCFWNPSYMGADLSQKVRFNIIDTPGHIDFTSEVKRSMRVLDGAVVVFDGVAGVEPQSETNWRYAEEAEVPRICYINKLDRTGGVLEKSYASILDRLSNKAVRFQLPIGLEDKFEGIIDLLSMKAYKFEGEMGKNVIAYDIPANMMDEAKKYRAELVERIVENDDAVMTEFLEGKEISYDVLKATLRKGVIANKIFPVLTGSSLKNKGVQLVLDAVVDYLPCPKDMPEAKGINTDTGAEDTRPASDDAPFSALVFKIQTDPFVEPLLTFFRVCSGRSRPGQTIYDSANNKKERVGRIVRLQADKREDVKIVYAGEIAAAVGMKEVKIGHTLCDAEHPIALESIVFPEPVVSMRVEPNTKVDQEKMGMALSKLSDEDPTFRVKSDPETGETIISGMGELHLEIIVDRMKREFGVQASTGKPQVAYRETIQGTSDVEYKHIKQTGGRGQYGHVKIRVKPMEPLVEGAKIKNNVDREDHFEFVNSIKGGVIPQEYIQPVKKGLKEALDRGVLAGFPVVDVSVDLYDGSYHDVDSSEIAFKLAAINAMQDAMSKAKPVILEPIMKLEVVVPEKFMGDVTGMINSKRGSIEAMGERGQARVITAKVPLSELFGFTTQLRSLTEGRGVPNLEFSHYAIVPRNVQEDIVASRK